MKREGILGFIFLVVLTIGFGSAISSSMTEFTIQGCTIDDDGVVIGLSPSECSDSGNYYCDAGANVLFTFDENLGCAMGNSGYDWFDNDVYCCPAGYACEDSGDGFKCVERLDNCYERTDPNDCNSIGCIWMEEIGDCVDDPVEEYSCGYYTDPTSCVEDEWNLGSEGDGSEFCGKEISCGGEVYVIPESECGCAWVADECIIEMSVVQSHYSIGDIPSEFTCSNEYNSGPCVAGEREVIWKGVPSIVNGFIDTGIIPEDCLAAVNCDDGSEIVECGAARVKLPGFSLFSLFASLCILGVYYSRKI